MKRTGNSKVAVVGWGRGMGHTGHMYLADAVIQQAADMKADPYFFISKTVGKDDPIYPEEKVKIYQAVFPKYANIFMPQGNLNQALTDLSQLGYDGVVVVVGADQKQAFQYLEKPNKEGVPVYQTMGFKKLRVISRQETRSKFANEEGPRATPMREILMNPNASEEDKFAVWRRDMPKNLPDKQVLDLMQKAEQRMRAIPVKNKKLKEFITKLRPLLKEANTAQRLKVLKLIKESMAHKIDETLNRDGYHVSVQKGKFMPSKFGEDNYNYLHDLMNSSESSGSPMLVTIDDKKLAREIAAMYGADVEETGLGTYRIVQRKGSTPQQVKTPELSTVNEFAPSDDKRPDAEYEVYLCSGLDDQFKWEGDPLLRTNNLGKAHTVAYELWKKHPNRMFMIWQDKTQGSRGGYGPKGSVLEPSEEELNEFAAGGDFKPPAPPKQKSNDPWGNDDRSKIIQAVGQLLKAGNKVDWKVPGQMGHVVRVSDDSVTMKRWGKPYSKIHYSLMLTDDQDDKYEIQLVKPGYYKVVTSDPDWQLDEGPYEYQPPGAGAAQTNNVLRQMNQNSGKFVWKKPNQIGGSFTEQELLSKGFKKSQYNSWGGTQEMWNRLLNIREDYLDEK
jgi:hypothetical protein